MEISRVISVPSWDEDAVELAAEYWRRRGFAAVRLEEGPTLHGKRGSGTLLPFFFGRSGAGFLDVDWTRISTLLTMAPGEFGGVRVEVEAHWVGVTYRMTGWAPAFYRLEIAELEHVLNGKGDLPDIWERFTEAERRGTSRWLWTRKLGGRGRLPEDWEDEFSELESRFLLA